MNQWQIYVIWEVLLTFIGFLVNPIDFIPSLNRDIIVYVVLIVSIPHL